MKAKRTTPMRKRREALGLTGAEVARLVGIERSHLAKIERGDVEPAVRLGLRIATVLRTTIPDLFPATARRSA